MFSQLTLRQKLTYCAHLFKALSKQHHKKLIPLLRPVISSHSIVLDVGGHAGQMTKLFAGLACKGRVYTFEPGSYAFSILRKTKALKGLSNVSLINQGLSSVPGEVVLQVPLKRSGSMGFGISHIVEPGNDACGISFRETINVTTLDSFVDSQNLESLDFIKIDVEGHELEVLKGGVKTLKRLKPALMIEVNTGNFERAGYDTRALFDMMTSLGYEASYIDEDASVLTSVHERQNGDYLFTAKK
ncbi:MAG: FkbM family methyltransferase [Alphaproteobacteria bacterium]|nr:FkbM family methyltransferase [Alphaproteobacteria bacterium]